MALPIFVVDSSPAVRRLVEQISTPEGFEVVGFQDGPAALEAARRSSPSLIIADYHLDNMTFSGFCKEINKLDNLTETYLISLVNPADRPDENHLRTLGVKAFLKKPFQSEDLLGVLKSLQQNQAAASNGKNLKRRVWPPSSTSTDSDDEAIGSSASGDGEEELMDEPSSAPGTSVTPPATPAAPEDAMKGLFDQLLQSMNTRSQQSLARLLPHVVDEKLRTHVQPAVQKELQAQLGSILSHEYLATIIHPLISQALPALIRKELEVSEPLIRQTLCDLSKAALGESVDRLVKDQVESGIHRYLPAAVREQLGSVEELVKDELQRAVLKQAPLLTDDLVRATVGQTVEQAVQRIVPDIAEEHIKAELKRLIETEEASHPPQT
ncbi:response regulator [Nitrospira sp. BLG_2]|uniref:response regulator n=1 Tax=Nitrospira sp. BLG_2 TaxID=3397507 RepID=UPI003B9B56CA